MKRVAIFIAPGFEEIEAVTVIDVLRRANIEVLPVSLDDQLVVSGAHGIQIITEGRIDQLPLSKLDGVVLPGGMPGSRNLQQNGTVLEIIRKLSDQEKLVAAICAAPIVLQTAGVLTGKKATVFAGMESQVESAQLVKQDVVVDQNIITGNGPAAAINFSFALIEYLLDSESAEQIRKGMLVS